MSASLVVDLAAVLQVHVGVVDLLVDLRGALVDSLVLGVVPSSHRSFPVEASSQRSGYS